RRRGTAVDRSGNAISTCIAKLHAAPGGVLCISAVIAHARPAISSAGNSSGVQLQCFAYAHGVAVRYRWGSRYGVYRSIGTVFEQTAVQVQGGYIPARGSRSAIGHIGVLRSACKAAGSCPTVRYPGGGSPRRDV